LRTTWVIRRETEVPGLAEHLEALVASGREEASGWWFLEDEGWHFARLEAFGEPARRSTRTSFEPGELPYGLTDRELDVLTLVAAGMTNRQIAAEFVTSVRTVSTQVAAILAKLGLETRAGAAAEAIATDTFRLPLPLRAGRSPAPLSPLEVGEAGPRPRRRPRRAPLRIGGIFPGPGSSRGDGEGMRCGASLAVEEINARGGVGGRTLEHAAVEADLGSGEAVEAALGTLLAEGVDAVTFGYLLGRERESLWSLLAEAGVPVLHGATSRRWVDRVAEEPARFANVFHVCPPEDAYLTGMAGALRELIASGGWAPPNRRVEILGSGLSFEAALSVEALNAALGARWTVARSEGPLSSPALFEGLERRLPAAVLVGEHDPVLLARFQQKLAARRLPILSYQLYTPSMPEYLRQAGAAADGVVWATVAGTYGDALGQRFDRSFRRARGLPSGRSHAGIAYDEVHLLSEAWAAVDHPGNQAAVRRRLRETPIRGVNGIYYFDHPGQFGLGWPFHTADPSLGQAHLVLQIQDGQHRVIGPRPYAEAAFALPAWF
jgi:branched-chain amino acid transport system substrate-binding protein